jgi:hypothetical protein
MEDKMITISQFENRYTQDVIDIVLHFQNDGTRPIVSVDDQPDLLNIVDEYINKGGNFWIAKNDETLIGTIGIMPYSNEIAVLKAHPIMSEGNSMMYFYLLRWKRDIKPFYLIHRTIQKEHINFIIKQASDR